MVSARYGTATSRAVACSSLGIFLFVDCLLYPIYQVWIGVPHGVLSLRSHDGLYAYAAIDCVMAAHQLISATLPEKVRIRAAAIAVKSKGNVFLCSYLVEIRYLLIRPHKVIMI